MRAYTREYPRPQLVRDSWKNLNGTWEFCFDDSNCGETDKWFETFPGDHTEIEVPYTYETVKSGIGDPARHDNIWYQRSVTLTGEEIEEKKVLLHFEGSDFLTKVWVNGIYQGSHKGGYARFSFDITNALKAGENTITVKAEDSFAIDQPRGKQRWQKENFNCWYVQTTGIWKTVWLESVPKTYFTGLKITPNLDEANVSIDYEVEAEDLSAGYEVVTKVLFKDTLIQQSSKLVNRGTVSDTISVYNPEESPWGVHAWSPYYPQLYDLEIQLVKDGQVVDKVESYFGLRDIKIRNGNILLNGAPLYQRLILDQGYWEESHLTPPDEEAIISDIEKIQAMGYNGVRKHMKIEDERFLYWCDVKGLLVWSEMAATYEFCDHAVDEFTREWLDILKQNYNHPSIITWTPFNESWGIPHVKDDFKQQAFTQGIYYLTKSFDPMRPVIVDDGWEHTVSDIITLHDYEEDGEVLYETYANHLEEIMDGRLYPNGMKSALADGFTYDGKPVIISEYGGIAFAGGKEGDWGYGHAVSSEEEFLERFDRVTTAIKRLPYCCGYCYTQVSDVQQEINGLLTKEHDYKIAPEKISKINRRQEGIHKIH